MRPIRRGRGDRDRDRSTAVTDPDFPFLTLDDAARLRALTRDAFAERGVETHIQGDYLQAADGERFPLRNLFATCQDAGSGERAWRRTIRDHVTRVIDLRDLPGPADLPVEELLAHAAVLVCAEDSLGTTAPFGYRRPLGGDLVELLAHDGPGCVTYLDDDQVERAGAAALRAAGVEHLLTEPFGDLHDVSTPQSGRFIALAGRSVHTASRLLTLDDVLRRATGTSRTPDGVLVAVPNRHQLVFHRPEDAALLGVVHGMLKFTVAGYESGTGPVSPHLYWRPPGGGPLEQLTRLDGDVIRVRIQGRFAEIVERLVGGHPPPPR